MATDQDYSTQVPEFARGQYGIERQNQMQALSRGVLPGRESMMSAAENAARTGDMSGYNALASQYDPSRQAGAVKPTGTATSMDGIIGSFAMSGAPVNMTVGQDFGSQTGNSNVGGGITTGLDPSQSTLSPNFSQYVYNVLGRAEGLANLPFQEYTGQRFAGPSALQSQAFQGIAGLGPSAGTQAGIGAAATAIGGLQSLQPYQPTQVSLPGINVGNVSSTFQAPGAYQPAQINVPGVSAGTVSSTYQAPAAYQGSNIQSGFQAPTAYQPTTFTSGYQAPAAYQAATFTPGYTAREFDTGLGRVGSIADYMSPYQQNVIDIQAREARRQADISRQAEQARLAQAGAYGGSRQAIMEAERQRNLGQQIGDIQERGLQSAYDRALQQRLQEAQLGVQAQQYGEQARQFGAGLGMQAQQAAEASRQFGSQQAAQAAQTAAQLGLEAQRGTEASRQFAAQQGMTAAQLQAQFGLDAAKANELSRQFGYQQQMTAQQLQAQFGLDAAKANQAAALQAALATQNAAMDAQRIQEQSRQFGAQQGMQGAQLRAQMALEADRANQAAALQAAGLSQQGALEAARLGEQSRQFGATQGLNALQAQLTGANVLGSLGAQEFGQGLQALNAQLAAGETQRKLEQEPLDFAYQQFQESMKYPYQQATFMQSMLQGLPLAARPYESGQDTLSALLGGGIGGLALYESLFGKKP